MPSPCGSVNAAAGRASARLFALVPASRAPFREMTAVPELRTRCARAAEHLAAPSEGPMGGMPWVRRENPAGRPGRDA